MIITKYTEIIPLPRDQVKFTFSKALETTAPVTSISSIQKLAPGQLIIIKGEVVSASSVKILNTLHSEKLKK